MGTEDGAGSAAAAPRVRVQPRAAASVVRGVWRHPANRGRRARKVAEVLAFQALGRLLRHEWAAPIGDHSRVWAVPQAASARAVYANPPDWAEMLAWRRLLPRGGLFVDVGANVGLYTIWALDCGAEVIAVEPHDGSAAELERNLALNDYQATVLRVALADKRGLLRLEGPDLPRQHLVVNARTAAPTGDEVQVETLDAVLGDRVASGVKVDVEGAEALVLAGATVALSEHRIKALQLEWNECSEQLLGEDRGGVAEMLASHGYVLFRPDPRGELVAATDFSYGRDMFALPLP